MLQVIKRTTLLVALALAVITPGGLAESPPNRASESNSAAGFEQAEPGGFDRLETRIGTWIPTSGTTIIDHKHAKTGKHCLQLTGGKRTSVTLRIAKPLESTSDLTFWAERWTKRSPF